MMEIPQTWEWEPLEVPAIFANMAVKRLSDLGPTECGVIERVDTPEEVMALVQMGCCIGSSVEVRHVALAPTAPWPFAYMWTDVVGSYQEAAAHLWVRWVAVDSAS